MAMLIKRYPNRKLYDTIEKQYITLDRIAELIRQGVEIAVVDYASGEDLTAVTLTQIIFEQEKKKSGFLPMPVLTGLVKAGGETLESMRRILGKPLDLMAHVEDEIERRIDILVTSGEMTVEDGLRLRDQLVDAGRLRHEGSSIFERTIGKVISERGLPSRSDYYKLVEQLELLTRQVETLSENRKQT